MKQKIEITLADVSEFIVDCLHNTAPTQEEGYPLIRTPNIGKGRLILEGVFRVSEDTYNIWTRRATPQPNDLILAREATAGNVAIIKEGQSVCLGQRTVHIRPDVSKVDPDFLCYYLLTPESQGKLLANETGATSKHVNMKDIRKFPLSNIPELSVQRKIGSIISQYDDLIENNRRRIQLLEESARLLYQEWFVRLRFPGYEHTKIVDGVPEGWRKKTLGETTVLNYGKALKEENRIPGPIPVYGSSGIVGYHEKPLVEGPGIIIGRKGNVGSVFWVDSDFHPIDTVYYVNKEETSFFLYYALSNISFVNTDVAVPGLNRTYAYSRKIIWPNAMIMEMFDSFIAPIHTQISLLNKNIDYLVKARDLLLPRLMNGVIPV